MKRIVRLFLKFIFFRVGITNKMYVNLEGLK